MLHHTVVAHEVGVVVEQEEENVGGVVGGDALQSDVLEGDVLGENDAPPLEPKVHQCIVSRCNHCW